MNDYDELIHDAEQAVSDLEAVAEGDAWSDPASAADEAVEALHVAACAELFPSTPQPVGADVLADLELYVGAMPSVGFPQALASLHRECMDSYPMLAQAIRGPAGRRKIEAAARRRAHPMHHTETTVQAEGRAIAEDLATFHHAVAAQLAERGEHLPAAEIISATVPALGERIDVSRQSHGEHAAAELERLEAEQRQAIETVEAEAAREQAEADEAARRTEQAARNAEREARLVRSRALADRIERMPGPAVRLDRDGAPWDKESLVRALRAGSVSAGRLDAIEAALQELAA